MFNSMPKEAQLNAQRCSSACPKKLICKPTSGSLPPQSGSPMPAQAIGLGKRTHGHMPSPNGAHLDGEAQRPPPVDHVSSRASVWQGRPAGAGRFWRAMCPQAVGLGWHRVVPSGLRQRKPVGSAPVADSNSANPRVPFIVKSPKLHAPTVLRINTNPECLGVVYLAPSSECRRRIVGRAQALVEQAASARGEPVTDPRQKVGRVRCGSALQERVVRLMPGPFLQPSCE